VSGDDPELEIARLAQELKENEEALRREHRPYAEMMALQRVTATQVKAALREGEALLEYVRYLPFDFANGTWADSQHYGVFVARHGDADVHAFDLGLTSEIDDAIDRYRRMEADQGDTLPLGPSARSVRRKETKLAERSMEIATLVLTEPVRELIDAAERLYIAPDGQLGLIPFEAIVVGERPVDGADRWEYLVERNVVAYLTTGRDLVRLRQTKPSPNVGDAVLVGDPDFEADVISRAQTLYAGDEVWPAAAPRSSDTAATMSSSGPPVAFDAVSRTVPRNWGRLPDSGVAVRELQSLFNQIGVRTRLYTGREALEERIAGVRSPRILQFATHGYFGGAFDTSEPGDMLLNSFQRWTLPMLESMLLLTGANRADGSRVYRDGNRFFTEAEAEQNRIDKTTAARYEIKDGMLTAYEVVNMDLRGTELVGLMACQTGLGIARGGEHVVGLREAFLIAGARSVVMSMWVVPTIETMAQMKSFYRGWLLGDGRTSRLEAFHDAQLAALRAARDGKGSGHPFFWGGFIYAGDPGDPAG